MSPQNIINEKVEREREKLEIQDIFAKALDRLKAHGCGLWRYDTTDRKLHLVAQKNRHFKFDLTLEKGDGMCGWLIENEKEMLVVEDYQKSPYSSESFKPFGLGSVLAIRLHENNRPLGVFFIEDPRIGWLTERKAKKLENLVKSMTIFLLNLKSTEHLIGHHEKIVNSAPWAIISVENKKIISWNWKAREIFGYSANRIIGQSPRKLYANHNEASVINIELQKKGFVEKEFWGKHQNGTSLSLKINAFKLDKDSSVGYLQENKHLTQFKQMEKVLLRCSSTLSKSKSITALGRLSSLIRDDLNISFCKIFLLNRNQDSFYHQGNTTALDRGNISLDIKNHIKSGQVFESEKGDWLAKTFSLVKVPRITIVEPISIARDVKGFICAGEYDDPTLDLETINPNLFKAIADQLSIYIQRLNKKNEAENYERLLGTLFESTKDLITLNAPEEITQKVVDAIHKASQCWWVSVFLFSNNNPPDYKYKAGKRDFPKDYMGIRETGNTREILKSGNKKIIRDVQENPHAHPKLKELNVKAVIGLPMKIEEITFGVIWLHYDVDTVASDIEIEALEQFANLAVLSYNKMKETNTFQRISEFKHTLHQCQDFSSAQTTLVEGIKDIFDPAEAAFWISDRQKNEIVADTIIYRSNDKNPENSLKSRALELTKTRKGNEFLFERKDPNLTLASYPSEEYLDINIVLLNSRLTNEQYLKELLDHYNSCLKHLRTVTEWQNRTSIIEAIFRAGIDDSNDPLRIICKKSQEWLQTDFAAILIPELLGNQKNIIVTGIKENELLSSLKKHLDNPVLSQRDKISEIEDPIHLDLDKLGFFFFRIALIEYGERGHGLLIIGNQDKRILANYLSERLILIAKCTASVVKNLLLIERNQAQTEVLRTLRALEAVETMSEGELLPYVVRQAWQVLPNRQHDSRVTIWIKTNDSPNLKGYSFGSREQTKPTILSDQSSGDQFQIVWECLTSEKTKITKLSDSSEKDKANYLMAIPINISNKCVAVLAIYHHQNIYGENIKLAFEALAVQISVALNAARLNANIVNEGKQAAMNWISTVSHTWSHDVKRECATGRLQLAVLKKRLAGNNDMLNMVNSCDQVFRKIMGFSLEVPLTEASQTETLDVKTLLIEYLNKEWLERGYAGVNPVELKLDFDEESPAANISGSRTWLERMFQIIAENAVRALRSVEQKEKTFTVSLNLDDEKVHIHIQDNGPGIPPNAKAKILKEKIFKKDGAIGTGIGLRLASTIAEAYGGKIILEENNLRGACFRISLPLVAS